MTQEEKLVGSARTTVKTGILFFLALFVVIAIFANMSGDHQGSLTNTFATVSGVLLALYSLLERMRRLSVTFGLLISVLLSLTSTMASYDIGELGVTFSKTFFVAASTLFAFTTYRFVSSIALEKFLTKKESQASIGAA